MSAQIPVWLDVDTGVDDAHALLLAARSPALELVGVYVTVLGRPPACSRRAPLYKS